MLNSLPNRDQLFLVIIAGGSGTRFWPKSTSRKPKQFLSFGRSQESEGQSLLAKTVMRFDSLVPPEQRFIVTTAKLEEAVRAEKLSVQILAEPQGRNTAPCIYWAARHISKQNPNSIMLVMPSDHFIENEEAFLLTVKSAAKWASKHSDLITLGIHPTVPETGFGYLKMGTQKISSYGDNNVPRQVEAFVEKPNLQKAEEFLKSENYLWNGGIFVWQTRAILEAFDEYMPEMSRAWNVSGGDIEAAYSKMTATSIDYGIMEKAKNVVAFELNCGWNDLGSWTSLETLAPALGILTQENTVNEGQVLAIQSKGNIIDISPRKLIALLGVHNLVIAETNNTLLVADKNRAQDLRLIVEEVKKNWPELA